MYVVVKREKLTMFIDCTAVNGAGCGMLWGKSMQVACTRSWRFLELSLTARDYRVRLRYGLDCDD